MTGHAYKTLNVIIITLILAQRILGEHLAELHRPVCSWYYRPPLDEPNGHA